MGSQLPSGKVLWEGRPKGSYYDFETGERISNEIAQARTTGVTVTAQTYFEARHLAATMLGLSPEHVDVEQWEDVELMLSEEVVEAVSLCAYCPADD